MTVVHCPYVKCLSNEDKMCSRKDVKLLAVLNGDTRCENQEYPLEPRMEVPTKDLALMTDDDITLERGRIIKALDDDIWVDEDHWWRAQMYARLAQIELFIHYLDEVAE